MNSPTKLFIGWKQPILFFVLHPDNFRRGEAIAPEAKRLGLWWSKNYQRDAQKNKISLDLLLTIHYYF
ncbi:hypothetical protein [Lutimonas vermicola]|uniref:Uncharacterized protein n=1 Tax=Lutimonas vermicola TaxID=414288 RepID=A0ABU9KXJ2_9FLAO